MSSISVEILPQTWQSFDLRQTASRRQFKSTVCAALDTHTGYQPQNVLLHSWGAENSFSIFYLKQISAWQRSRGQMVSEKHCFEWGRGCVAQPLPHSWGSHSQLVTQSNQALIFIMGLHYICSACKTSMAQYNDRPPKPLCSEKDTTCILVGRCESLATEAQCEVIRYVLLSRLLSRCKSVSCKQWASAVWESSRAKGKLFP